MIDAARDDEEFAGVEIHRSIAKLHPEFTAHKEEHLVLIVVVMPDELAQEPDQLDLLAVEIADDLRAPVLGELGELLGEINFGRGAFHWNRRLSLRSSFF